MTVWDADPRIADEKLRLVEKVIQGRDFTAMAETINAVDAWLGSLPGHVYANVRQPPISTLNLAHMIPLSAVWAGPERDEHFAAPPLLFGKTEGSTPFRFSLHVGDVGHTLIVGPTGAGTRVIGQYDNGVGFGQRRVLLVWTRLIFPNGRSIVLERQPGADAEGFAGLEDGVDHHWWDLAKAAGLSTLLSIGSQAGSSGEQSDLARAIRQGASDGVSQVGRQVVGRQLDIAPTLTIRPGFPVRLVVTRDLVLEPYGG